ncbi:MAG: hypothetical protein ACI4OS_00885 [Akkermansia sp.]
MEVTPPKNEDTPSYPMLKAAMVAAAGGALLASCQQQQQQPRAMGGVFPTPDTVQAGK